MDLAPNSLPTAPKPDTLSGFDGLKQRFLRTSALLRPDMAAQEIITNSADVSDSWFAGSERVQIGIQDVTNWMFNTDGPLSFSAVNAAAGRPEEQSAIMRARTTAIAFLKTQQLVHEAKEAASDIESILRGQLEKSAGKQTTPVQIVDELARRLTENK